MGFEINCVGEGQELFIPGYSATVLCEDCMGSWVMRQAWDVVQVGARRVGFDNESEPS